MYTSVIALFLMNFAFGQTLKINEFMASNVASITDEAMEHDDWFEIFNSGTSDIDLGGYYLTDNATDLTKYQFPIGNPNTIIHPGGHLIVWADDSTEQGVLHTNFKLAKSGEFIGLLTPDSVYIDSISFGAQLDDKSFGRSSDGASSWIQFNSPTPGSPNMVLSVADLNLNEQNVVVYPNPADDFIVVKSNEKITLIEVVDVKGISVLQTSSNTIDLTNIDKGVYFVRVYNGDGFENVKFIKK